MKVERKILKSVSEFSVFKYVLVAYLIFFILFIIVFAIIGLIGWGILAATGITLLDVLNSLVPGLNFEQLLTGIGISLGTGGFLGVVVFIIVGLLASVFAAAIATLVAWLFNVVLKIVGGMEIRFLPEKLQPEEKILPEEKMPETEKPGQLIQEYNINNH